MTDSLTATAICAVSASRAFVSADSSTLSRFDFIFPIGGDLEPLLGLFKNEECQIFVHPAKAMSLHYSAAAKSIRRLRIKRLTSQDDASMPGEPVAAVPFRREQPAVGLADQLLKRAAVCRPFCKAGREGDASA